MTKYVDRALWAPKVFVPPALREGCVHLFRCELACPPQSADGDYVGDYIITLRGGHKYRLTRDSARFLLRGYLHNMPITRLIVNRFNDEASIVVKISSAGVELAAIRNATSSAHSYCSDIWQLEGDDPSQMEGINRVWGDGSGEDVSGALAGLNWVPAIQVGEPLFVNVLRTTFLGFMTDPKTGEITVTVAYGPQFRLNAEQGGWLLQVSRHEDNIYVLAYSDGTYKLSPFRPPMEVGLSILNLEVGVNLDAGKYQCPDAPAITRWHAFKAKKEQ